MCLPQGWRCGGPPLRLNPSRQCTIPSICIDPPGTHFAPSSVTATADATPGLVHPCTRFYHCATCSLGDPQKVFSSVSCEETAPGSCSAEAMDEGVFRQSPGGEGLKRQRGGGAPAHLQMSGLGFDFQLMRQKTEQLEKLQSMAMEGQLPVEPMP